VINQSGPRARAPLQHFQAPHKQYLVHMLGLEAAGPGIAGGPAHGCWWAHSQSRPSPGSSFSRLNHPVLDPCFFFRI
jgi:hypothetical protein